jgi:alanine-glyoxylate transaminase/serine-glyoxylate transaminase/serine-pyruvate transaminase
VRRAVAVWSKGKAFEFNIVEAAGRSDTVTAVLAAEGFDLGALQAYCNAKCGVVLGRGLGKMQGKAFRVAHMGHINAPMVLGTIAVIEMGLGALGIAHGKGGIQAATEWLSEAVKP